MDSLASKELLGSLTEKLKCTFATTTWKTFFLKHRQSLRVSLIKNHLLYWWLQYAQRYTGT